MEKKDLKNYNELNKLEREVIREKFDGTPVTEMAKKRGITQQAMHKKLNKDPGMVAAMEEFKSLSTEIDANALEELQELGFKHSKTILKQLIKMASGKLEKTTRAVQLNAINSLMDRLGFATVTKSHSTSTHTHKTIQSDQRTEMFNNVIQFLNDKKSHKQHKKKEPKSILINTNNSTNTVDTNVLSVPNTLNNTPLETNKTSSTPLKSSIDPSTDPYTKDLLPTNNTLNKEDNDT